MKTAFSREALNTTRQHGFLQVDLLIAMVILALAIVPLGFSFMQDREVLHLDYTRAVANEIVDGEMEVLAAGDWKNFPDGAQNYTVRSRAAANLPPGHFELTKTGKHLRLEWRSDKHSGIAPVIREVTIQ